MAVQKNKKFMEEMKEKITEIYQKKQKETGKTWMELDELYIEIKFMEIGKYDLLLNNDVSNVIYQMYLDGKVSLRESPSSVKVKTKDGSYGQFKFKN